MFWAGIDFTRQSWNVAVAVSMLAFLPSFLGLVGSLSENPISWWGVVAALSMQLVMLAFSFFALWVIGALEWKTQQSKFKV